MLKMETSTIVLNDAKNRQKYYAVCCKCGHVRPNRYVLITFPVKANNGREAAKIARGIARVKHNKKNAIVSCKEISYEEYQRLIENNKNDPYLGCKNVQDQRKIEGFESRIIKEPEKVVYKRSAQERKALIGYKLKKQKLFIRELNASAFASI